MFWIPTNHDKKSIKQNQGKTMDILVHIDCDEKKNPTTAIIPDQSRAETAQWIHGTPQKGANGDLNNFKVVDMTPVRNNRTRPPKESSTSKSILIPELKKGDTTIEQGKIGLRKKYSRTQSSVDALDFTDVDSIDNDASSVSSHQSHELFNPMRITIGKKDGILMLESEEDEISLSGVSSFNIDYMDDNDDNSIDEMDDYDQYGDSRDESNSRSNHIQNRKKDISTTAFELESTKHQNHKDDKQKKYHQIRIACLEVAIESYKKAKVEVPDIILAQLNDHRNLLLGNVEEDVVPKVAPPSPNITSRETNNRFRYIKLHSSDEIHVAPCQCALRLVGMKERSNSIDTQQLDEDGGSFGKYFLGLSDFENDQIQNFHKNRINGESQPHQEVVTSMVRTKSAQAQVSSNSLTKMNPSNRFKSSDSHNRSDSNLFTSMKYHEIMILCGQNVDYNENEQKGSKFERWDALTFRCKTHDELDTLIKALKDSSDASVIPFSSNPKERLKQLRKRKKWNDSRNGVTVVQRKQGDEMNDDSFRVNTQTSKPKPLPKVLGTPFKQDNDVLIHNENISSNEDVEKSTQREQISKAKKEKMIPWDLNFNKKEYCELCDLTFTLLTRRHHCRQCERSCCSHCSRLLIVKGCDEKRFCNTCSADILQKQSKALRGRMLKKTRETVLPGKVHSECQRLGVGVIGKLPHWKTFLTMNPEQRPAVGRITVEVLEALALPSVDMVNGRVDPYVRATVTGYDRDIKWTLREWLSSNRYSICSGYCSATLSPQWRGSGRKGGELLTLPVISTAGAVLRLEVLHYNVLTNSRGKDTVLGVVEIPLSDLPNANLRHPGGIEYTSPDGKIKSLAFDGYCDRWYRLLTTDHFDSSTIVLSKPSLPPQLNTKRPNRNQRKSGKQSLDEVGKRVQALAIAPVEWFAQMIKLDLPAKRPEAICKEHEARSMIHVRIKLNASIQGDILSHAWFPPIRPRPLPPPYDPAILLTNILQVVKQIQSYDPVIKYIEHTIQWKYSPWICTRNYFIFALHLAIFPHLLPILHVYLFIFLWRRLHQMTKKSNDDSASSLPTSDSFDDVQNLHSDRYDFQNSPSLEELSSVSMQNNKTLLTSPSKKHHSDKQKQRSSLTKDEEVAKLNTAVHWLAKRFGENKGLEILQFKLGMLGKDLKNINAVWNGTNILLTKASIVSLMVSFILHFLVNQRVLWIFGTFTWYFAHSPLCIRGGRMFFGFFRGVAKVTRRQHLLDSEILEAINDLS